MDPFWLFFFLVLAVIGSILAVSWQLERQRTETLSGLSGQLGMFFDPKAVAGNPLPANAPAFALFKTGYGHRSRNHFQKTLIDRTKVHLFDYQYTTGGGKSRTIHRITLFAAQIADCHLPTFRLHPEMPIFHSIAKVFGMQDIEFPTHPDFSRLYLLRGEPEDQVRGLFQRGLLDFFEHHPQWCVEAAGSTVVLWRQGRRLPSQELADFLALGEALCQRLKGSADP